MDAKMSKAAGAYLQVASVKELAKQPLSRVPARYVRPELDLQVASNTTSSQVPIIDMSKLLSPDFHESELQKLDYASKEWGFFQLINHGVSPSLVETVKIGVEGFFNLPMEEKKKLWQKPGDPEGFGQHFVVSEEQKLEWADLFYLVILPQESRNLFSNIPLPFRDNLEIYSVELRNLAMKIIQLMGEALNMEPKETRELFEEGRQAMRMNYYPPCPHPEKVIGLNPHSDVGGLTILLQVNEMEGLQIRKDGKWVSIKPLPNAFTVNIGDVLEILSNGIYRSIEHRATVNSEKERISIATFYGPKVDGIIGPSPSLVIPERPALFRRMRAFDYYKEYFSRELGGKSHLDFIRIQNDQNDGESI